MTAPLRAPASDTRLTAGLFAITVFSAFEQMAVGPVMPVVSTALDGAEQYGLAFAAALATGVIGMVAAGVAVDRGRLPTAFLLSGVTFSAGLLLMTLAPAMDLFIVGRLIQGLGSGGLAVCGFASVGAAYPVERHRPVLGLIASAWLLPSLFGPGLAVVVAELADWRWLFLGVAVTSPVALALVIPPLRRRMAPPAGRASGSRGDVMRLLLSVVVGAGVLVVSAAPSADPGLVLLLVGVGMVVAVLGLWPVLPRGFFGLRRGLPAAIAARAFASAAIYSVQAYLPLLLAERYEQGVLLGGLVLTAAAVGWAVAAMLSSRLQRRFSAVTAVRAGSMCLVAGVALTAAAIAFDWPPVALAAFWAVVGLSMGVLSPATTSLVLRYRDSQGENTAALTISESSFSAVCIAIGGVFVASSPGLIGFVAVGVLGLAIATVGSIAATRASA